MEVVEFVLGVRRLDFGFNFLCGFGLLFSLFET